MWFDTTLSMKRVVSELCNKVNWKLSTLFRASKLFDIPGLVIQFKARILGYIEYRTPAIYHADATVLKQVDSLFEKFIRGIGLTKEDALKDYSLAPLSSRRDIAMLGVIHRAVLGKGPEQIRNFFPPEPKSMHEHGRNSLRRHKLQLQSYRQGRFLERTGNSVLGLVDVYNLLPSEVVEIEDVHNFQSALQGLLKVHAKNGNLRWEDLFSPRLDLHNHPLRRILNATTSVYDGVWEDCNVTDATIAQTGANGSNDRPPAWW